MRLLLCLILLFTSSAFADDPPDTVSVKIKSILCEGDRAKKKDNKIVVHDDIRDLRPKLVEIPYKSFMLTSSQTISIPKNKKRTLDLPDGDKLALELLYLDEERVGLWIDWKDPEGMQLLDTRMHFDCMETMLAGAEGAGSKGKVLAISVDGKK